jgi:hypothetical protein
LPRTSSAARALTFAGTGGTALTSVNLMSGGFSALFPQSDGTVIAVGDPGG